MPAVSSDHTAAMQAALRLLSFRARSEQELVERLRRRGFGAEVVARIAEETHGRVQSSRVGAYHLPIPNARPAEERVLPDVERVLQAIRDLV